MSGERDHYALEIDGPTAECGHCHFLTALTGKFSVEDGRLVWRGDPDPQPRRGPDLDSCCESDPVVSFERITVDGVELSAEQTAALRQTAVDNPDNPGPPRASGA